MEVEKELVMQAAVDAKIHNELGRVKNEKTIYIDDYGSDLTRLRHHSA